MNALITIAGVLLFMVLGLVLSTLQIPIRYLLSNVNWESVLVIAIAALVIYTLLRGEQKSEERENFKRKY